MNYVFQFFNKHITYVLCQKMSPNYRFVDFKLFHQDPGNWLGAKEKVNKNNTETELN